MGLAHARPQLYEVDLHSPILYPGTGTAVLHKTTETESPARELVDRPRDGSDDHSVYTGATPLTLHDRYCGGPIS